MSAAHHHNRFALRQSIRRVADQTPSISYRRLNRGTGGGITNRHVAQSIHRKAGHPAPQTIGAVIKGLLLRCGRGNAAASYIELVPPNRDRARAALVIVD